MPIRGSKQLAPALIDELTALRSLPDERIDYSDAASLDDWSQAERGLFANRAHAACGSRIRLPPAVARIFDAVRELEQTYPDRKFTPDGHLVGSIGEVIAAEALGLTLHPMSRPGHDAHDRRGDVQIKMTAGKVVAMYGPSVRLVVLQIVSSLEAEIVYDGPGQRPWDEARKPGKNGQRTISVVKLRALGSAIETQGG